MHLLRHAATAIFILSLGLLCPAKANSSETRAGRPPVDWIFLVDTSQTMLGKGLAKGRSIFGDVKNTIDLFLDGRVRSGDSVQIIPFDRDVRPMPPTYIASEKDKAYVRSAKEQLRATGPYTYIGLAIQQSKSIVRDRLATSSGQPAKREVCVVIFTDGIDEPPPGETSRIDLKRELQEFPRQDTVFYFVNLGDASPTNSLRAAMKSDPAHAGHVFDHPGGNQLPEVANVIGGDVDKPVVEYQASPLTVRPPLRPEESQRVALIDVVSSIDSQASVYVADATPGLQLELLSPGPVALEAKKRVTLTFRVTGDSRVNDSNASANVHIAPFGDQRLKAGSRADVTITVPFHRPTFMERALPWAIAFFIIAVLLVGAWWYLKWLHSPNVEGLLYWKQANRSQYGDPINLRQFARQDVRIGGTGAEMLSEDGSFSFRLHAGGRRDRIPNIRVFQVVGPVAVNDLEGLSDLHDGDEIAAGNYKFKYENPRLSRPDEL